jgi:uncharacterized membrane protein HdeD (DUF308 family)
LKNNKSWWLVLLKGIILIVLAIYIFRHPVNALVGLTFYIGLGLLFTGAFLIITSLLQQKTVENWGWRLGEGIIDVIFAIVLLTNPNMSAAIFPFVIGFWIIVYGVRLFGDSFKLKKEGASNWWMLMISGLLTVLIGYFIKANILVGAIAITILIGLGFLIFGIINVSISLEMRKWNEITT